MLALGAEAVQREHLPPGGSESALGPAFANSRRELEKGVSTLRYSVPVPTQVADPWQIQDPWLKGLNASYVEGKKAGYDVKAPQGQACSGAEESEGQGSNLLGSLRGLVGAAAGVLTPRTAANAAWAKWRNLTPEPGMGDQEGLGVFAGAGTQR